MTEKHRTIAFGIDTSASMAIGDCEGGKTRIELAKECVREAYRMGVETAHIVTFGKVARVYRDVVEVTLDSVLGLIEANEGDTALDAALRQLPFDPAERTVFVVLTDGPPTDVSATLSALEGFGEYDADVFVALYSVGTVPPDLFAWVPPNSKNISPMGELAPGALASVKSWTTDIAPRAPKTMQVTSEKLGPAIEQPFLDDADEKRSRAERASTQPIPAVSAPAAEPPPASMGKSHRPSGGKR
jgi:hypothetical protein